MNAPIEWIDEPPQLLGALGAISWKNQVPDESLKTFQAAINVALRRCGYYEIAVDGKLGPNTCGAYAMLGDLKNKGCVTDTDWQNISTAVGAQVTVACQSYTYPTKRGEAQPDQPTSKLTPEELALPWGRPDPRTADVQRDLNNDLDGHDYFPIPVTGTLDAKTCGAMRLASTEWGMNYEEAFGLNCEAFEPPQKRPSGGGGGTTTPTCADDEKFDPATGQCVKISCPTGQVFNPATGQCEQPPTASSSKKSSGLGWGLFALAAAAGAAIFFGAKPPNI